VAFAEYACLKNCAYCVHLMFENFAA